MAERSHEPNAVTPSPRMLSVDALRGFDMFWLVGGTGFALAIVRLFSDNVQGVLLPQLDHRAWEGCTFYDVIFPLFVFVSGMSVVFSLDKRKGAGAPLATYRRILRRFVLLFLLGILYYGGLTDPWPNIRLLGVLQRIALCYLVAALLYYHFRPQTLVVVCIGILVGYWALLMFVPVPGSGVTGCSVDMNWARYIDEQFLPGERHDGTWDNCGLLSTLPAIGTALLGVFAAIVLKSSRLSQKQKLLAFIAGGVAMTAVGWAWGFHLPVIKKIWTSSYVLVTGGYSFVLLGLFYLVVDVWGYQAWAKPFVWIGANPLTIYLARNFVDFNALANRFVGGSVKALVGQPIGYLLQTSVSLAFSMLLVWFLYRKRIFLRV